MAGSPRSPVMGTTTPPSSSIPAPMSRSTSCSRIRATSRPQACTNHWALPRSIRPSASPSRSTSAAKPACPASTPPATSPTPSWPRSPRHHRTARWRASPPSSRCWFESTFSDCRGLSYSGAEPIQLQPTRWPARWARWGCSESAGRPVVHGDRAAAERLRRDQLEPSRAGQPALVQGRAVAGDPGVDEELVLVDQIQPVQLGRELAAPEEHAVRSRVLELLYARTQVPGNVVAVGPREVLSRRGHHVLWLGLQLDRPLVYCRRCLRVAAGDRWPVAFHHLVGHAAPQHGPALVHEASEEGVGLVVGDSFLVVDAAVQGDVDTEGQESHGVLRSRYATSRPPSGCNGTSLICAVLIWCRRNVAGQPRDERRSKTEKGQLITLRCDEWLGSGFIFSLSPKAQVGRRRTSKCQ